MKKALEVLKNLIITGYILLIIFVTICLLSFNDYKVTVFGKSTLIPIIDEDLEPNYTVGDLVIAQKGRLSEVEPGDEIFFYRTASGETTIHFATVTKSERVTDTESTYTVEGDYMFSSSNYIGKVNDAIVIPHVGKILTVLQSKWGFLFLGVFPSLVAFLYTLHNVFVEIREVKEAEEKAKKKKKKKVAENVENNANIVSNKSEIESNKKENINVNEEKQNIEPEEFTTEDEVGNNTIVEEKKDEYDIIEKEKIEKIETTISIEREVAEEKVEDKEEKENVIPKENKEKQEELTPEQKKKALIEAKMKSMTEEEKRALIEAKLKSMTPEEKRALIEAKKKKMEAEKNKKGE